MKTLLISSTLAISSVAAGGGIWMLTTPNSESSSNISKKNSTIQVVSQPSSNATNPGADAKAFTTQSASAFAPRLRKNLPSYLPNHPSKTTDSEEAVCEGQDEYIQEGLHDGNQAPCVGTPPDIVEDFDTLSAADKRIDFPTKGLPHQGADPRTAKATIVQCSDFDCPFCVKASATMEDLLSHRDDLAFYFVHSPLEIHEHARMKAWAATAAQKQGKFWVLHDALYENKTQTMDDVITLAESLGLDGKRLRRDMEAPATEQAVEAQTQLCRDAGAKGTPAFFVNGVFVPGARPIETFEEILDRIASEDPR